jgi:hypothetical protein
MRVKRGVSMSFSRMLGLDSRTAGFMRRFSLPANAPGQKWHKPLASDFPMPVAPRQHFPNQ